MSDEIFIPTRQVRRRYGDRSHMWIERRLKDDPEFPRPYYFGRLRFFKLSELEAYERRHATRGRVESE